MPKCVLIYYKKIIGWTQNVDYGKYTYSTINGDNIQYAFRYFIIETHTSCLRRSNTCSLVFPALHGHSHKSCKTMEIVSR